MAVSRALRRLLRIRHLEEEQSWLALSSAVSELHSLEAALQMAAEQDRRGRRLVAASAHSGELPDRLAGIQERRLASRCAAVLAGRIEDVELDVEALRQAHLSKRVERRQVETLIGEAEAQEAIAADRRAQQAVDDWYRNRVHRSQTAAEQLSDR